MLEAILNGVIRIGLAEMILDHLPERDAGESHVYTWGKVLCTGRASAKALRWEFLSGGSEE